MSSTLYHHVMTGITTKRQQTLRRHSRGIPFGQKERLTSRIKRILSGYPCDKGKLLSSTLIIVLPLIRARCQLSVTFHIVAHLISRVFLFSVAKLFKRSCVRPLVGPFVGPLVGPLVGPSVGPTVNPSVGPSVGPWVGLLVRTCEF